jgi:hypothetical protein
MLKAFKEPIQDPNAIQLYTSFSALALNKQVDVFSSTGKSEFYLLLLLFFTAFF